jgi:hypothetical protein
MSLSVVHPVGTQKYESHLLGRVPPLETEEIWYKPLHYQILPSEDEFRKCNYIVLEVDVTLKNNPPSSGPHNKARG